jgi:flagellin
MGLQINTNVTALNALRNLTTVSNSVAGSIEKLSSGMRINSAADDPAGLIISQSLKAQIGGLNQAISNSQDATNVIKTAEGALAQVSSLLDNVRQLAVHAANTGVNDQVAVQADQAQISSAVHSIERIAEQTQFGSKHLLDGTSGITASVVDSRDIAGVNIGGVFNNLATQSGTVNMIVSSVATRAQVLNTSVSGAYYASVNSSISTVNGGTGGSGGTVVINGQSITVSGSDTVQTLINKINNLAGTTGVSADFTYPAAGGGTKGYIVLTQQNYGSNFSINESESSAILAGTAGTLVSGLNATVTVVASALVNGQVTSVVSTFTGGRSPSDSGLMVTDTAGNSILLTEGALSTYNAGAPNQLTVASVTAGSLQFQIGGNAGQTVTASLGNVRTANLGNTVIASQNLSTIDVTTTQGAQDAIQIVDNAIQQVSQLSANLGAFQAQTLGSTISYLGVGVENLSASESQITDTNVAQEVVNLTKNQIIQQAATSMLAQANQAPQQILRLLQ